MKSPSILTTQGIESFEKNDRNNLQLLEETGRFYAETRNYPEAQRWFAKLQRSGGTGVSTSLLEAEIARGMGESDKALKVLRAAVQILEEKNSYKRQWTNAKLVMASIEMEKKQCDSALRETMDVTEKNPKDSRSYVLRGDIYAVKNELVDARNSYKDAMTIDPDNQFARRGFEAAERLLREK